MYNQLLYRQSPRHLQELLISGRALLHRAVRRTGSYRNAARLLDATEWYSADQLRQYQEQRLTILSTAIARIPYYREYNTLYDRFDRYPYLDKSAVNQHWGKLIDPHHRGLRASGGTSGTSGQPLRLIKSLHELRWEQAFVDRQLRWAGVRRGARRAWLRGDMIVQAASTKAPFWRRSYADNTLLLSSYHLSERSAGAYLDELYRFDPELIQAYPSSVHFLAQYLLSTGKTYRGTALKAIVTSSETLWQDAKQAIEAAFGTPVYDWYGSYERVAAIGTCEQGRRHLLTDYSFVELLPAGADRWEIVGTTFYNLLMPLVRYRSGDYISAPNPEPCPCGRAFPTVEQVYGRDDDAIITPEGLRITRLDHVFKYARGIIESQIVQSERDSLTVNIVPGPDYDPACAAHLRAEIARRVGNSLQIQVNAVSRIERGRNGKLKAVVSSIGAVAKEACTP